VGSRGHLAFETFPKDKQDGVHGLNSAFTFSKKAEHRVVVLDFDLLFDIVMKLDQLAIVPRKPSEEQRADGFNAFRIIGSYITPP